MARNAILGDLFYVLWVGEQTFAILHAHHSHSYIYKGRVGIPQERHVVGRFARCVNFATGAVPGNFPVRVKARCEIWLGPFKVGNTRPIT